MVKLVMILSLLSLQVVVVGQGMESLETYESSLIAYYKKQWIADREEFKDLKRKPIFNYLPDVGFLWGFPNINFRLSNIWNYKRDKYLLERRLASIDLKSELKMNASVQELRIRYAKLEVRQRVLEQAKANDLLAMKVYEIGKECCSKRECTPKECLELDLLRQNEGQVLLNMGSELEMEILELEQFAKYSLPSLKLNF